MVPVYPIAITMQTFIGCSPGTLSSVYGGTHSWIFSCFRRFFSLDSRFCSAIVSEKKREEEEEMKRGKMERRGKRRRRKERSKTKGRV